MKTKTIVALWHTASKGKTATLREVARLLNQQAPEGIITPFNNIPNTGDFRFVIEINGIVVGIESQGDPNTNLENCLFELANEYNCSVIFCATRTRGSTVEAVDSLLPQGFQTIWTSTYQIDGENQQNIANRTKAKHLLDLLGELNIL